jgi:TorA maturation chaperone TorD
MDWMRVMSHLALKPGDQVLPPDHLAICCEIFAQAVARGEDLIVQELRSRYLLPWCDAAAGRLSGEDPRFRVIVEEFREALEAA